MRLFTLISFLLPATIQGMLLVIFLRRQLFRRTKIPFFFGYTLYSIVVSILRLLLSNRLVQYPMFYWSTEVIYGILALLAINEVFARVFRPDYAESPGLRLVFPAIVLATCIGLFTWWRFAYRTPDGRHLTFLWSVFVGFNEGVHSIEGILLGLFLLFWLLFRPGWNRYDYGILLGFGLSGFVTMTADMVRFDVRHFYRLWSTYAPGVFYVLVTAIWLYAFWPTTVATRTPVMRFRAMLEQTRRSNEVIEAVHEWLRRRMR